MNNFHIKVYFENLRKRATLISSCAFFIISTSRLGRVGKNHFWTEAKNNTLVRPLRLVKDRFSPLSTQKRNLYYIMSDDFFTGIVTSQYSGIVIGLTLASATSYYIL